MTFIATCSVCGHETEIEGVAERNPDHISLGEFEDPCVHLDEEGADYEVTRA